VRTSYSGVGCDLLLVEIINLVVGGVGWVRDLNDVATSVCFLLQLTSLMNHSLVGSQWPKKNDEGMERNQLEQRVGREGGHVVKNDGGEPVGLCQEPCYWVFEDGW